MAEAGGEVVRFYTSARRFPRMFGRFADGTPIPGGPYTAVQFFGALGSIVLLWNTIEVWGRFGLTNGVILLGVPAAVTYLLRGVNLRKRNPLTAVSSGAMAYLQPRSGRIAGRAVRLPRPHRARGRLVLQELPELSSGPVSSATSCPPRSAASAASTSRRAGPGAGARGPAARGLAAQGSAAQGSAAQGSAAQGSAAQGSAAQSPQGRRLQGGQRGGQQGGQQGGQRGDQGSGAVELLSGVDRLLAGAARAGATRPVPVDGEGNVA